MDEKHYEVGYGKPPKQYQFKKGNPGRSRIMRKIEQDATHKYLTWDQILSKVLDEPVRVSEGGKRKHMTKMEAFVRSLINEAIKGDKSARRAPITLAPKLMEPPGEEIWTTRVTEETLRLWDKLSRALKDGKMPGLSRHLSAMKEDDSVRPEDEEDDSVRPENGSNNSAEDDQDR